MKVSSTLSCCPCSWPYFLTLSYISGKKNNSMEETLKPASLSLHPVDQSFLPSQSPASVNTPSDMGESLKSPNMSTDSGFEGENNRPLLLTTMPSPSKDTILSSWSSEVFSRAKESLHFDGSELTSPKSPKKSTDDSDFNESPFEKKSVPGVPEMQSESDNEFGSEHNCSFIATDPSWKEKERVGTPFEENVDMLTGQISAFSVCLSRSECVSDENKNKKNHIELNKCPSCQKLNFISREECVETGPYDVKWNGRLASIHEDKDCVIYAETNSEEDYDPHCKPDTETDTSDEKIFDGAYSDETLSAYYVPSAVSVATEDYHQPSSLMKDKVLVVELEENSSEEDSGSLCLCHIGMCKSSRCQRERARYTTVLKPKAVRPSANPNRVDYHSSLESLHGHHVVAAIGHHRNRLSAFHERPASSLSQNEGMQYFFSRSLEMPPTLSSIRQTSSQLSVETASDFVASNACLSSESHNEASSLTNIDALLSANRSCKSNSSSPQISHSEKKSSKSKADQRNLLHNSSAQPRSASQSPRAKRFSMPWDLFWKNENAHRSTADNSSNTGSEPIHMTLEEVHSSLQILSPQDACEYSCKNESAVEGKPVSSSSSGMLSSYLRHKKTKSDEKPASHAKAQNDHKYQRKSFPVFIRSAFSNLFGLKKNPPVDSRFSSSKSEDELPSHASNNRSSPNTSPFSNRALPPLPAVGSSIAAVWEGVEEDPWTFDSSQSQLCDKDSESEDIVQRQMDYAASIEKVKDCGWYWGPISGETAEKLLSGEPDGSFIVRDSSDEHYIFSLTFKLNGLVRHVRIEHDHGNFSFGCLQKFRSNTIVDFIDSAVAHSRSGRFLFFLHRRPVLGPMRVQLLHPVSRFKQVQSLQHLCRFIILKTLRRDLIDSLPLPRRLKDYLNTPHYYSEELATLSLLSKKRPECRRSSHPETTIADVVASEPEQELSTG